MKKTSKLKSKLCAWFLVCATVVTTLTPSSSMVFAENNNTPTTETEFSTLSVKSGEGGEISVELPDGQTETASNGNDITVEVETGSTIKATVNLAEGYEVATYRLTTDSGDSEDIETYDSFSFELTEDSTLEATYSVLEEVEETPEVTNEETTTEETEPEVESTEPETEDTTVPVEETTPEEEPSETAEEPGYVAVSKEEIKMYEEGLVPEKTPNYEKTYSGSSEESSISTFSTNAIQPRMGDTIVTEYGSKTLADTSGLSRDGLLWWLGYHVSDNYYLSTPYNPGFIPGSGMSADYRNPNGDCENAYGAADKPGVPGMNCTGFVWHALTMAGGGDIPALSGWVTYIRQNDIQYRTYTGSNVTDIINTILYEDNYIEPGDVIWTWDADVGNMRNGLSYGKSDYHHVGIYVGDVFDNSNPYNEAPGWFHKNVGDINGFWHSSDHGIPSSYTAGNMISNILPKTTCTAITVVKTGAAYVPPTPPAPAQGDVTLKKSTGACFKTHPQQHKCTFKLIIRPIYILTYMILDLLQVI